MKVWKLNTSAISGVEGAMDIARPVKRNGIFSHLNKNFT